MELSAFLTSVGINSAIAVLLFLLYSVLRKQPGNLNVYFGPRLALASERQNYPPSLLRYLPSPSWVVKAWETTEDDILALGGMDALVFVRIIVFSIRIFCIAAVICMFLVLPVNYYGKEMIHHDISSETLEIFTIANVKESSEWLWTHCFALYVITCSACGLLYFEHKSISRTRLAYITGSPPNPSHFTVLVRAVPWSAEQSYSESVKEFFMKYYASSYLSHHMVHRSSRVQRLMNDAERICRVFKSVSAEQKSKPCLLPCFCGAPNSFDILSNEPDNVRGNIGLDVSNLATEKENAVAFVCFKTRYAAVVAAEILHSENPMLWVTEMAPEPNDVLWSNLSIPYRQLWIRKIAVLVASIAFMFVFLIPVTFVQSLTQLEQLSHAFPFLKGMFKKKFISQVVTGYLPSVILILFLYAAPPTMMVFSTIEGSVAHSGRKKSACIKVLYFTIWNVFFVNVLSGSVIGQLTKLSSVKDVPKHLAEAIPNQVGFFMTYVLTSVMAPLILPFLLIYFVLAYLVYKNQIINVYKKSYESGGQYWPIAHKTIIASLVLTQIIALGIFGIKKSPVASGFTIPLIVGTLLFNEYCRQRFFPSFQKIAAQVLTQMDQQDEQGGRMEEIYQQLKFAYCQFRLISLDLCNIRQADQQRDRDGIRDSEAETAEIGTAEQQVDDTGTADCYMDRQGPISK
ncbi:CSC1-like protein RXW8 [Citrus sinensis]|uniref:CSC1-like protein RXW8 n=2 Tax=Citrus sinensis TaxID=2711 RepID=A0ACB8KNC7_CITSI|nr:CSC1-like protein RXW8 [Citrus sinensis]